MNKINDDEKLKLQHFLHLNDTMRMILNGTNDKDKLISTINSHHTFVQGLLIDFGIKFDHLEKIKGLNQKIREMESNFKGDNINEAKIATYIDNKNKELKKFLKENGFKFSCSLSFSPDLNVSINLFSVEKDSPNFEKFNNEFKLLNSEEDYYIIYSEDNLSKLKFYLEDFFKEDLNITYNIVTRIDSDKNLQAVIKKIDIYIPVTASSKAINEAFKERY